MPIYRPRMLMELTVPIMGDRAMRGVQADDDDAISFLVELRKVRLVSNDANHADEASVTCDWRDAGTDPRLLQDAVATIFIGNADDVGRFEEGPDNVRFVGIMKRARRVASDGEPMTVDMEFLDYTTLFLEAKPFGFKGVPDYSQPLDEAWARICSQTPGADVLADRLVLEGINRMPKLSDAVHSRLASGPIAIKPDTDAWAVWRRCIDILGLISFIRGDQCVVTTDRDHFSQEDPVRMTWGRNILEWSEARNPVFHNGVGLRSFDPVTGRVIDALYPPEGDPRIKRKIVKARKKKGPVKAPTAHTKEWEFFPYPGVTDKAILFEIARRVWEERSRQELEGTFSTAEMFSETLSGKAVDLLNLKAGDSVQVEFDPEDEELLSATPAVEDRIRYLKERGYAAGVAELMAKNMGNFSRLRPVFLVRSVETTLEVDGDGGKFEIQANYVNRISIMGDSEAGPP